MGVEAYLLAAALRGVLAQRLVRRLCAHCAEYYAPTPQEQQFLQLAAPRSGEAPLLKRSRGCEHCRGTGYTGRLAVQELLPIDEYMGDLITAGAGKAALLSHGAALGWRSLYADAVEKVLAEQTTVCELWRAGIMGEEIAAAMHYGGSGEAQYVH